MRRLSGVAALALTACATGGFSPPDPAALKFGETTQAEVLERMGAPTARETIIRNGKPVTVLAYVYATEAEKHHGDEGVIASRSLHFFFHDERLVGHEFNSSIAADHTDFDTRKARTIVKGQSRDDVTRLLGAPSGYLVFPLVSASAGEAMLYSYRQSRRVPFGAPIVFTKNLVITFDAGGTVTEAFYAASGNR